MILQTLIAPGEALLLDRNCHKSVHHGVVLSGAQPIYMDSSVNRKYGVFGPVPKKTILKAIDEHPEAQLLVLTSCTYDGLRYDLKPIVDAAHARGIKVLIDEAWFARAVSPCAAPDRARIRCRLRHAIGAQDFVCTVAGRVHPCERPDIQRAHLSRKLQHAYIDQSDVQHDRQPRRQSQAERCSKATSCCSGH